MANEAESEAAMKLATWRAMLKILPNFEDRNVRAVMVQSLIADMGPVPNELGEQIRALLK